jgi:hypothetical protein
MGRQLVIITETPKKRKPGKGAVVAGRYYSQTDFLPPVTGRFNEEENEIRVHMLNHIYNYKSEDLTPHEIIHQGLPHHSEDGEACKDECVCGHSNVSTTNVHNQITIKTHSDYPMTFQTPPMPEYLVRMEYNKKNNIKVVVELWDTDDRYNKKALVKKIAP